LHERSNQLRNRFLNMTIALGLVVGLMAGVVGSASADTSPAGTESQWIYFPWVPNGEMMDGAGPWYGTVTIQNLENYRVDISILDESGGTTSTTTLEPNASKTMSADQLGVGSPGGAVAVQSAWDPAAADELFLDGVCDLTTQTDTITKGGADTADAMSTSTTDDTSVVVTQVINGNTVTYVNGTDFNVVNHNSIDWSPAGAEPATGTTYTVSYTTATGTCRAPVISGVEKHVMANPSNSAKTNADTIAVDGYTATPMQDVAWGPGSAVCHDINGTDCVDFGDYIVGIPDFGAFDGHSYIPIAQTNSGWDTILHISLVDPSAPDFTSVTITLYTAGSQGAFGPSVGSFTQTLSQGQTWTLDLSADAGIPDGWVGDVWITSDYGVVAVANRQKPSTDMAITNQSAPSLFATTSPSAGGSPTSVGSAQSVSGGALYTMVAPLVFKDYNGWNIGINIANISELTNTVSVNYVGPTGATVGSDSVSIPAKAMEYIYTPASQDLGLTNGFVGAAILSSTLPFHAAVDEVKYAGQGQDVGQATSYIATDAGASAAFCKNEDDTGVPVPVCFPNAYGILTPSGQAPFLAIPLIQKGSPFTGLGDTSGINLFNASSGGGATVDVTFFQPSGALAAPTLQQPYELELGPLGTATVYTMDFSEMSAGFQGSAIAVPVSGSGIVFGVSNNVNYDVQGDGSAVYNMINTWGQFRFFCSQEGVQLNDGSYLGGLAPCLYFTPPA
jgi:hypothetical protein